MKSLLFCISAMFFLFAVTAPAHAQWPEFDPNTTEKSAAKIVDDGYGSKWTFSHHLGNIQMWRDDVRKQLYPQDSAFTTPIYSSEPGDYSNVFGLKIAEKSLPPRAGINLSFYGYLKKLHEGNCLLETILWVDRKTGQVNDVMFNFSIRVNKNMLFIPTSCFTIYEDILKKTVRFELPHEIRNNDKEILRQEDAIFYVLQYSKFPAPAEGEPDFLALPEGE